MCSYQQKEIKTRRAYVLKQKRGAAIKLSRNGEKQREQLTQMYIDSDKPNHHTRLKEISEQTTIGYSTLVNLTDNYKWKEKRHGIRGIQEAIEEVLVPELKDVTKGDAVDNPVDRFAKPQDVAFSTLASELKDQAYTMLKTARNISDSATIMINFYSQKMKDLVIRKGGVAKLNAVEHTRLELWQKQIGKYKVMVDDYIKPNAIVQMLKITGMEESIQTLPEDAELGLLTPVKLMEALEKVGFASIVGQLQVIDELKETDYFVKDTLPDVDGRRVKGDGDII